MRIVHVSGIILCLLFIGVADECMGQVNLQNGLVAYYTFNGNVADVTGNNHNGAIVNGVQYAADRFGNLNSAARFYGNNDYLKIVDDGAFSTPRLSISLWFKTDSDDLQNLVGKRKFGDDGTQGGGAQYQFFINYSAFPGIGSNLVGNNSTCSDVSASSYINTVDPICKERWYHAVITFDGSRHKIYINGVLKRNEATTFNSFLICNSEIRFGTWWSGGTLPYKGLMDDIRWYNRALTQDEVLALYDNYSQPSKYDFNFEQNICSPKIIQFFSNDVLGNSYSWDFGNGMTAPNIADPIVDYNTFGVYQVNLKVVSKNGCIDSATKLIPILATIDNSLIAGKDTAVCSGNSVQLTAPKGGLGFCWFPITGLSNAGTLAPIANPLVSTTYYFTSQVQQNNLVVNGDFSQGNTGFTSGYKSAAANTTEAQYYVANDPRAWNVNFNGCVEHTTGSGKMMMVNGSSVSGATVWSQNIAVTPNTNYGFSVWIQSLAALNLASLKFSINGVVLGDNINAGTTACEWKQVYTTWNSGNSSTATISIVNNNTIADGNDFAIDDITFSNIIMKQDSIRVTVTSPPTIRSIPDTTICKGAAITLTTTGGSIYNWTPVLGLSNPAVANPVATPGITTRYIVSAFNTPGCVGRDTVDVTLLAKPKVNLTKDTLICAGSSVMLNAGGGTSYFWHPLTGLNAGTTNNTIASPLLSTRYYVDVKNQAGCTTTDSVMITVASLPTVTTINDTTVCQSLVTNFKTGTDKAIRFSWSPGIGLMDSTVASPNAMPIATTQYVVTGTDINNCKSSDTLLITILPKPAVTLTNDTLVCKGTVLQLKATGGQTYNWIPLTGLSDPGVSSPSAKVDSTITYKVITTGANGCSAQQSVKVSTRAEQEFKLLNPKSSICAGEAITLSASGGNNYMWYAANVPTGAQANDFSVQPTSTTTFQVKISDTVCNRSEILSTSMEVNPLPVVSLSKSNDIDCSNASVQLAASGGVKYQWLNSSTLANGQIPDPIATPLATTTYTVKVTNAKGCSSTDSIAVNVSFANNLGSYNLPNAFTPNGDGKNDCFGLKYWGGVSDLQFSIYDRWGERVFYTTNVGECWNGVYKNVPQNSGAYVYVIKAKSICIGNFVKKGTFVLIR